MTRNKKRALTGILFILPGLISYLLWTIYPILNSFFMSMFKWNINPKIPNQFIGIENYINLFKDEKFYTALINTLKYTVVTVPGQLILGLIIAILLNRKAKGSTFFRLLYYLPVVTSWVVVSVLFQYLFSSRGGMVNYILKDILHFIPKNIKWLSDPSKAMIPIYILGIWKGIGWSMLIFLAGLQGIPKIYYEAAQLDGASSWKQVKHITLPLLRPTMIFQIVMLTIGGFNVFLSVFVMTGGGPRGSTEVLSSYMFKEAFSYFHFGYASAISFVFFIIVFTISQIQRKFLNKDI
ncbi:MAG: sugar ABC transporter permease [Thermotogae bacterium]|nr:sugar ABC transporter permease [Thermotogota bacterium]